MSDVIVALACSNMGGTNPLPCDALQATTTPSDAIQCNAMQCNVPCVNDVHNFFVTYSLPHDTTRATGAEKCAWSADAGDRDAGGSQGGHYAKGDACAHIITAALRDG